MKCRDCPYIAEEFHVLNKRNDEDVIAENGCWCDKIGGRMVLYMNCGDVRPLKEGKKFKRTKKHRTKRERDEVYKKYLKHRAESYGVYSYPHVVPVNKYGYTIKSFEHEQVAYYKRLYHNNRLTKCYKRVANRVVRQYKGELHNGALYKKCFDYRFTIW